MTPTEIEIQLLKIVTCSIILGFIIGIVIGFLICWWANRNIIVAGQKDG